MVLEAKEIDKIVGLIKSSKIGILPTDTIYGLHCLAFEKDLLERVYEIKKRPESKKFISIISKIVDLELFDIYLDPAVTGELKKYWPGSNTFILEDSKGITHAIRYPDNQFLQDIMQKTGPLISTSANLSVQEPLYNINDCIETFGDSVDFYVDGGLLKNPPSNIYKVDNGIFEKIR